jgi:hypothetical protein
MKQKVIIATPFYSMNAFSPYVTSLVKTVKRLSELGIDWDFYELSGDSYVDRARNTICNKFLEGDGTDLIFIDSDMAWPSYGIEALLNAPYDVVGGAYPMKNSWESYPVLINNKENGTAIVNENGLIGASFVPAGFLKITRKCLERFKVEYSNLTYENSDSSQSFINNKCQLFFEAAFRNGQHIGEDVSFCRRWLNIGGEIWIEPRINLAHIGQKAYIGNYHEFLLSQPQPESK